MFADPLQSTIRELEERLMTPHIRNDRSLIAPLLVDEFLEFGSSGRIYDKEAVLSALAADRSMAPRVADFSGDIVKSGVRELIRRRPCWADVS